MLIGICKLVCHAAKFSLPTDTLSEDISISTILYFSQLKYSYMNEVNAHLHPSALNPAILQRPTAINGVARA